MSDIIQLLPDSVANQIAAGEVIQRPASVIKELVENAVDAGADKVQIIIKDAGKSLIQVIDNGCGMSETDARMAFERHATSKIQKAEDLFNLHTLGFRGEALASIVAVAQVELKTKRADDPTGIMMQIHGSEFISQETVACSHGSNFAVKNLFYNIPARRKFLKSNSTEMRHILEEVNRIALINKEVQFVLTHNDVEIYNLPKSNLKQRIVNIIGKNINQNLIDVNTITDIVEITGYIGKPEFAKKSPGEQYFFVNNRYMRHPFFYKAVLRAYDNILQEKHYPAFFIFIKVDPQELDVNIHPTKTEIKFTDELAIRHILHAAVKESLGKFNVMPAMDFDSDERVNIPYLKDKTTEPDIPQVAINTDFNPFEQSSSNNSKGGGNYSGSFSKEKVDANWQNLYEGFENKHEEVQAQAIFTGSTGEEQYSKIFQFKNKYIMTPVKSGLMIIDQKRAKERILYEEFLNRFDADIPTQKCLFPITIELNKTEAMVMDEILEDINDMGYELDRADENAYVVTGIPADAKEQETELIIRDFIANYKETLSDVKIERKERTALSLSKAANIRTGMMLDKEEMKNIIDKLFACKMPNHTATGKSIISIMSTDEIEKRF